jgi:hypothetical protein
MGRDITCEHSEAMQRGSPYKPRSIQCGLSGLDLGFLAGTADAAVPRISMACDSLPLIRTICERVFRLSLVKHA